MQAQRKFQIAHYGRTPAKIEELGGSIECPGIAMSASQEDKKCNFITLSSDPVYVAYHDEEWGVPVHDDRVLFELLVLTGAQVGMDWTTILKKRNEFRVAFAEFDAESVSKFTEKQMVSISVELKLDLGRVRGISLSTLKQN
ncbi:DNA-3-methyladenine glycosylase 1-like [Zingiber officinale]|nr:DNA-3-methyladenine glycosylase 1-like [Zingiber officinale]